MIFFRAKQYNKCFALQYKTIITSPEKKLITEEMFSGIPEIFPKEKVHERMSEQVPAKIPEEFLGILKKYLQIFLKKLLNY